MSFSLELLSLDQDFKTQIRSVKVKQKKTQYVPNPPKFRVFSIDKKDGVVYLPIGVFREYLDEFPYSRNEFPKTTLSFCYTLYTKETDPKERGRDQNVLVKKAIQKLKKDHTVLISAFTGYGKTSIATYLICWSKLKAVVICPNDTLKEQWKTEILKFTSNKAKVQIVKSNKLDPKADVYIVGPVKASKFTRDDYEDIGIVVVDEAHMLTRKTFTDTLFRFGPMYLVGLSATPDRKDGLDGLFSYYFGDSSNFLVRSEKKPFTVYKYETSYKPEISYTFVRGKTTLDWSKVITSLAENQERTQEIAHLAMNFPTNKIIIICDRNVLAESLFHELERLGDSPELLIGSKKKWDKTKRILVTGMKKGGVGLDDESLDLLILAADMKDVRQCEGRIRVRNNIVIDVVDDFISLERHWKVREKWYISRGATISSVLPK